MQRAACQLAPYVTRPPCSEHLPDHPGGASLGEYVGSLELVELVGEHVGGVQALPLEAGAAQLHRTPPRPPQWTPCRQAAQAPMTSHGLALGTPACTASLLQKAQKKEPGSHDAFAGAEEALSFTK